jgi:hypothetical protein
MSNFKECTFTNSTVRLDNNEYVNCKFEKCIIEFAGEGPVGLDGCAFSGCQWVLVGYARNTLNFLGSMYHGMGDFGKEMVEATFTNIKTPQNALNK